MNRQTVKHVVADQLTINLVVFFLTISLELDSLFIENKIKKTIAFK